MIIENTAILRQIPNDMQETLHIPQERLIDIEHEGELRVKWCDLHIKGKCAT